MGGSRFCLWIPVAHVLWGPVPSHPLVLQSWYSRGLEQFWFRQGPDITVTCIWIHIPHSKTVCKEVFLCEWFRNGSHRGAVRQRRCWRCCQSHLSLLLNLPSRQLNLLLLLHLLPELLLQLLLPELPLVGGLALGCGQT